MYFGQEELVTDKILEDNMTSIWKSHVGMDRIRRFTVQAFDACELLVLTIKDLLKMKLEFPKVFAELLVGAREKLIKDITLKLEVIKFCEIDIASRSTSENRLKSIFSSHLMGQMIKGM